jgi:hypothetical protein
MNPRKFTFPLTLSILFENKDYQFCTRNANIIFMRNILLLMVVLTSVLSGIACGGGGGNVSNTAPEKTCPAISDTPTEAYKRLYTAVKAKNSDGIAAEMSKKSQEFALGLAQRQNKPIAEIYVNGFTGTTFAETLPEIRDERIAGCWGGVEVRNSKDQIWEDLPFTNEDGMWKFAIGELFGGTFKSPGKSQGTKEKEAANSASGNVPPSNLTNNNTSTMANTNVAPAPKYDGPQVEPLPNKK